MSRLEPRNHIPAKVFAQFTSMGENEGVIPKSKDSKLEGAFENRREIQISETGEVNLPPDKAKVSIVCSNAKESVEEVKTSVNRRVDYVLQTLKSHHVKDFIIHKTLNRINDLYQMEIEVVVEFSDFSKCEQVCNLLVEKLDETVKVSSPVLYHTASKLESLRRQACVCAVRNAKNKALEVVQILNQSLGPPMLIKEEHYEEYVGNNKEISLENKDMEHLTFQEKVALATVTVTIKIFAIFEIKEKMKVHKQK